MSKRVFQAVVGLAVIGSSFGVSAMPAQAESQTAQCQRFSQAMTVFSQQLRASNQRTKDPIANIDRWLNNSERSLKQLQNKQFSDPKIRLFQQKALDIYVEVHNSMMGIANSVEKRDRQAALSAYTKLLKSVKPEQQLKQQFVAYCYRR